MQQHITHHPIGTREGTLNHRQSCTIYMQHDRYGQKWNSDPFLTYLGHCRAEGKVIVFFLLFIPLYMNVTCPTYEKVDFYPYSHLLCAA